MLVKLNNWESILEKFPKKDIYFSVNYFNIFKPIYSPAINAAFCGEAEAFYYEGISGKGLFPYLKRPLRELPFVKEEARDWFDVISAYGYNGPIVSTNDASFIRKFKQALALYCNREKIVCVFIRFHPLLKNHVGFEATLRNKTVYINLNESINRQISKRCRNAVSKAIRSGVRVKESPELIKEFSELYLTRMKEINASQKYLFTQEFFERTFKELGEQVTIFTAMHSGKLIAASMFLLYKPFIHYHFSAAVSRYRNLYPTNLMLVEAAKYFRKQGYKWFHLGGGLTDNQDDTLFKFKASFSPHRALFYTGEFVFNRKLYKQLVNFSGRGNKKGSFFPAYRE